jgi:hypothetical protein
MAKRCAEAEKPATDTAGAGQERGRRSMLRVDPVGALTLVGFEGLDGVSSLLHCARHEAADCVTLPSHLVHNLDQRRSVPPLKHRDNLSRLAAIARSGSLLNFDGSRFALKRVFRSGGTLVRLAFLGRALGHPCAKFGGRIGLPLCGHDNRGTGAKLWMRSQMRLEAALLVLKLVTGATPAMQFQIAIGRPAGQPAASFVSSCWLLKLSNGLVDPAAAASSAEPNAVIVFSLSIVNVVMIFSFSPRSAWS